MSGRSESFGFSRGECHSTSYSVSRGTGEHLWEGGANNCGEGTSVGRSYSYGGPPHLVQRWMLRQHIIDFIDDELAKNQEANEALITAARNLLAMLY